MRTKVIRLEKEHLDKEAEQGMLGEFLDDSHYDTLVRQENVKILKPNGETLLHLIPNVLPSSEIKKAAPALEKAAAKTDNRGYAGGKEPGVKGTRHPRILQDGIISKTIEAIHTVESGIIGFFDRNPRFPYCRATAFTAQKVREWSTCLPLLKSISDGFKANERRRFDAQMEQVKKTCSEYIIPNTVFTTITVNRNWRTAAHYDAGDLPEGFGVMTAIRWGKFDGAYLVFPKYRVAVDLRNTDLLLSDVHEMHANTPFQGVSGAYQRISLICYYRKKMVHCLPIKEELKRARSGNRRTTD